MSSNIKTAMVDGGGTGSGLLVDITTSVTAEKQINVPGGISSNTVGAVTKFKAVAGADIYLGDYGPRASGVIKVSAPSSSAVITVFYG